MRGSHELGDVTQILMDLTYENCKDIDFVSIVFVVLFLICITLIPSYSFINLFIYIVSYDNYEE